MRSATSELSLPGVKQNVLDIEVSRQKPNPLVACDGRSSVPGMTALPCGFACVWCFLYPDGSDDRTPSSISLRMISSGR